MLRLIVSVMEPLREWHTEQSKALRSCSEVCDWYIAQASGPGGCHLRKIASLLSDAGLLSDFGVGRFACGGLLDTLQRDSGL